VFIFSGEHGEVGAANVCITSNDPQDFRRLENYFDVIVVMRPAAAAVFPPDPEAIDEWSWTM